MKLLWITDPWDTLDHPRDTTLRLMQEGILQGISQYWCDVKTIRLEGDTVRLDAWPILEVQSNREKDSFLFGPVTHTGPDEFQQIHYRTDPPVDFAYLHPLQLLFLSATLYPQIEFINPLNILFSHNEKMEASLIKELAPLSIISSQYEALVKFGRNATQAVLKPLYLAQSIGIEKLSWETPEDVQRAENLLQNATANFTRPVLLQQYLKSVHDGEIRLWFLDGELLAYAKKQPPKDDFRVNMDRGSQLVATNLSAKEQRAVKLISSHLKHWKIRLAAIDLIEGYITDFNFTSPGLLTQMEIILGENLAKKVIQKLCRNP